MREPRNRVQAVSGQEARQVAEEARETEWRAPSFLKQIFLGNFRLDLIHPFPQAPPERPEFRAFYERMQRFLLEDVDGDAIDREGKIPQRVIEGLARMGAFGMKIPKEYGGLGFTQSEYAEVIKLISSWDGNLIALLYAHQSIGVPQPLKLFGTKEQKEKYFPRLARGAVSAFALTEADVGSDPAKLSTTAARTPEGDYILNGEKLWCTNGTIAELFVVMARHPDTKKISAFIVEKDWPGVEVVLRCHFMGLKAIENGVIRFTGVRVPKENLLWDEGRGLKLALVTLNTGRLTLPATSAAVAKMWNSEEGWTIVDRTVQVRGGRGYETADSLKARGEPAIPVERIMRDYRINLIFEGSSEIMRLFIAREALDRHLSVAEDLVNPKLPLSKKLSALPAVLGFYARWYPGRLVGRGQLPRFREFGPLARHIRYIERATRRLSRSIFHMMARHGPRLEKRQALLFRAVDIGADLFAMSAATCRAQAMRRAKEPTAQQAVELADIFCRGIRRRIAQHFAAIRSNDDLRKYRTARKLLAGEHLWLERGLVPSEELEKFAAAATAGWRKEKELAPV